MRDEKVSNRGDRTGYVPPPHGSSLVCSALCAVSLLTSLGCRSFHGDSSPERLQHGYTLILPGILGKQFWDQNVAESIHNAEYPGAIEVYDWTHGPLLWGWNMFDGQRQVEKITAGVMAYQDRYPGRPVYLVGHSGGCKIVVQTLERLPEQRRVEKAILLAPGLHSNYDLRPALNHTHRGICAFSSAYDIPLTIPLTGFSGLVRGKLWLPAATVGFKTPSGLSAEERERYEELLAQQRYSFDMLNTGHPGGHFGWTTSSFVSKYVVPQLTVERPPRETVRTSWVIEG